MNKLIERHLAQDHVLKEIIRHVDWPAVASTHNVLHDLLSCVVEQQIHYRSSKRTFAKLLAKACLHEITSGNFSVFEETLNDVKLSSGKYETIANVLEFFEAYDPSWTTMSDEEVRKLLSEVKGVGKWTIDMVLMYTLERPDVLPVQDYHLRKIMTNLYSIDPKRTTSQIKLIAKNWAPYRSLAVKYLFAWKAHKL